MGRKKISLVVAALVVIVAAGGYGIAKYKLQAMAEDGLKTVNAYYVEMGYPPFTYEDLESDIFAQSVTFHGVREKGNIQILQGASAGTQKHLQGEIDTTIKAVTISNAGNNHFDTVSVDPHVKVTSVDPRTGTLVHITFAAQKSVTTGVNTGCIPLTEKTDIYDCFDKNVMTGTNATVVLSPVETTQPSSQPSSQPAKNTTITLSISEIGMTRAEEGGQKVSMKDIKVVNPDEKITTTVASADMRVRSSTSLARLILMKRQLQTETNGELAPLTEAQKKEALAMSLDYLRSFAGLSLKGITVSNPDLGQVQCQEIAVDTVDWKKGELTDLAFHIDHMIFDLSDANPQARVLLAAANMKTLDQSLKFGLHYDPDQGTLRVDPLSMSAEQLGSLSVTAGLSGIQKVDTTSDSPEMAVQKNMAAVLHSAPTPVSVHVEDFGGIKNLIAFFASQDDLTSEDLAQQAAMQVALLMRNFVGEDNAQVLFSNVGSFLTDKSVLDVTLSPVPGTTLESLQEFTPNQLDLDAHTS